MLTPKKIYVSVSCSRYTDSASLKLISENSNDVKFEWEQWINAALAIVKSHNSCVKNRRKAHGNNDDFVGPLDLIKKVDLSRPMLTLNHSDGDDVLSNLPGQLNIWTAWPLFDVRFCQFELDQWMDACAPCEGDEEGTVYKEQKSKAMKILTVISTWDRT